MADKIRRDYRYVEVPDQPGEGARVLGALHEQGVSLLSMTAFPTGGGNAQIDLVAGSGELEKAAEKAGLKLSAKKQAFFVTGADRPGAVAALLKKLADAPMDRHALEEELRTLAAAARERRSVDGFTRAAIEGFSWGVLAGVCGKLVWDSRMPPLFFWPLALLDLLLLCDAASSYLEARKNLRRELRLEARVRELRAELGIDAPLLMETGS